MITEKSTAPTRGWQEREHKRRQQGPKGDLHRELFDSLNLYAQSHNVWIISPPNERRVRLECPLGSNAPADLAAMGFKISGIIGQSERLIGTATQVNAEPNRYLAPRMIHQPGFISTAIYEICLPKA
jgi:hypothetical protein